MSLIRVGFLKTDSSEERKTRYISCSVPDAFNAGVWNWVMPDFAKKPGYRAIGISIFLSCCEFNELSMGFPGGTIKGVNNARRLQIIDYFS